MSEFVDNLDEVFALFGAVRAKRMFGGYGLYHDNLVFGLVADEVLYLKATASCATMSGMMARMFFRRWA